MIWKWERIRERWPIDTGYQKPSVLLGWCYRDWDRDVEVFYIMPLNLIIAGIRWINMQIAFKIPNNLQQFEAKARMLFAYKQGQRNGYEAGRMNRDVARAFAEECERLGIPYNIGKGF